MAIDVWMQHPTLKFFGHPAFESVLRWTGLEIPREDPPIASTIAAMDAGGIEVGLVSAWHGPEGPIITNDEVARRVAAHPKRLAGIAAVDLHRPMHAVRELRR